MKMCFLSMITATLGFTAPWVRKTTRVAPELAALRCRWYKQARS
jgi:hypothetical protein